MRATAIGSMPLVDGSFAEATSIVVGELPEFPHVVELPHKGPGADMCGRTGALLSVISSDLSWETTTTGWRHATGQGVAMRRGLSMWSESLDALEERLEGYQGQVKTQLVGPWTFVASMESSNGNRALHDAGFVDDITDALVEAVRQHIRDMHRRIPKADLWVQIDEPAITSVLNGSVPTASGLHRLSAIDPQRASRLLNAVVSAIHQESARAAIHSCAAQLPWSLLLSTPFDAISFDVSLHQRADHEYLGQLIDMGRQAWLGVVPTTATADPVAVGWRTMDQLRRDIGFSEDEWSEHVAVTPACGLGDADVTWTRRALAATREILWQA